MKHKFQVGFTLIELLVVISIIGLLSAVILVSLSRARMKAREAAVVQSLQQIRTALEVYYSQNGQYPSTNGSWYSETNNPGVIGGKGYTGANGWIPNFAPQYIAKLPTAGSLLNTECPSDIAGWYFVSDGKEYKVKAACLYEEGVANNDLAPAPFTDPNGRGATYVIYTPGLATW